MSRTATDRADALPALAEVFREHGHAGASLSRISAATGLGKGSLYNFFPGGKDEMMAAVLADIADWFEAAIFSALELSDDPARAIAAMIRDVDTYFNSGGRVCLVGTLGLSASRDPFTKSIRLYFERWIAALATCIAKGSVPGNEASTLAERTVAGIQGAIVLARALDDENTFRRILRHHEKMMLDAIAAHHSRHS